MIKEEFKSFFISIGLHLLVLLLFSFIKLPEINKNEEIFREVSLVMEREFPQPKTDEPTSLSQQKKVKETVKSNKTEPTKTLAKEEKKVETLKKEETPLELARITPLKETILSLKEQEIVKDINEEASKVSLQEQKMDSAQDKSISADIFGGEKGENIVDLRPSPFELFGPIENRNILYAEIPEYPAWAQSSGIEEEIRMKFWVDPEGNVNNITVIKKSSYFAFESLAKDALAKWKFSPLDKNVQQIQQWGEIVVKFMLI